MHKLEVNKLIWRGIIMHDWHSIRGFINNCGSTIIIIIIMHDWHSIRDLNCGSVMVHNTCLHAADIAANF